MVHKNKMTKCEEGEGDKLNWDGLYKKKDFSNAFAR